MSARNRPLATALLIGLSASLASWHTYARAVQDAPGGASTRIAERLRELQQEADGLAAREKSLLSELRQLELQRQMKGTELAAFHNFNAQTCDRIWISDR